MSNIGLIAGSGELPLEIAKKVNVYTIGFSNITDKRIEKKSVKTNWFQLGDFLKIIEYLKQNNITQIIIAGKIHHTKLFATPQLDDVAREFVSNLKDFRGQTALKSIVNKLESNGIKVLDLRTYIKNLIVGDGVITQTQPSQKEMDDINFAKEVLRELSKFDIGQTVIVRNKTIVAVEGVEGTDECIKRAGKFLKNAVVVKLARKNQDVRFDLPVIGIKTVKLMKKFDYKTLAIETDKTIVLSFDRVIDFMNKNNMVMVGIN